MGRVRSRGSTSKFTNVEGILSTREQVCLQDPSAAFTTATVLSKSGGLRYTTPSQEEQGGRGGTARPPRTHRGGPFWPLWCTSRISVAGFPWGLDTRDAELAAAWGHCIHDYRRPQLVGGTANDRSSRVPCRCESERVYFAAGSLMQSQQPRMLIIIVDIGRFTVSFLSS